MTSQTHSRTVGMFGEVTFPNSGPWTHVKTGHQYVVLFPVVIEATATIGVAYAGADGLIWVRPVDEFLDGRFA